LHPTNEKLVQYYFAGRVYKIISAIFWEVV